MKLWLAIIAAMWGWGFLISLLVTMFFLNTSFGSVLFFVVGIITGFTYPRNKVVEDEGTT